MTTPQCQLSYVLHTIHCMSDRAIATLHASVIIIIPTPSQTGNVTKT